MSEERIDIECPGPERENGRFLEASEFPSRPPVLKKVLKDTSSEDEVGGRHWWDLASSEKNDRDDAETEDEERRNLGTGPFGFPWDF